MFFLLAFFQRHLQLRLGMFVLFILPSLDIIHKEWSQDGFHLLLQSYFPNKKHTILHPNCATHRDPSDYAQATNPATATFLPTTYRWNCVMHRDKLQKQTKPIPFPTQIVSCTGAIPHPNPLLPPFFPLELCRAQGQNEYRRRTKPRPHPTPRTSSLFSHAHFLYNLNYA